MGRFLIVWLINAIALIAVSALFDGIHLDGWSSAFWAAALLGLINVTLKPIAVILTLPLQILTLGVFMWVVNAGLFLLVSELIGSFAIDGFWSAFWGAMVYSIITWSANNIFLSE